MADRLAQADAFHFLGAEIIIIIVFIVFMTFDPVVKASWSFIQKHFRVGVDNSVAPEPSEAAEKDEVLDDGNNGGWGQQARPSEKEEEEDEVRRRRELAEGLKLIGIPEFDIAVRSKLLVGPPTYLIQDVPRYEEAFETVEDEHAVHVAALEAR